MKYLLFILNIASAILAFVAAALWWQASIRIVRSDYDGPMESSYIGFLGGRDSVGKTPDGTRFEVIATLLQQSRFNSWAAKAAALAAILQGINVLIAAYASLE